MAPCSDGRLTSGLSDVTSTSPNLTVADQASHQFVAYYVMGLTPGVTYYWRVDEIEKDGVTVHPGTVWSFTMQATTAYHPSPVDGATDASVTPTLMWLPGSGGTKHQVYFGDSLEAVQQGAAGRQVHAGAGGWLCAGAPKSMTTYYWRVDDLVGDGVAGPVWSSPPVCPWTIPSYTGRGQPHLDLDRRLTNAPAHSRQLTPHLLSRRLSTAASTIPRTTTT
jgi:hypothetical protein